MAGFDSEDRDFEQRSPSLSDFPSMHRIRRILGTRRLLLGTGLLFASVAAAEEPGDIAWVRPPSDSRWDAPWDPGTIFLPPLGSIDVLVGRRLGLLGTEDFGFLTLNFPLAAPAQSNATVSAPRTPPETSGDSPPTRVAESVPKSSAPFADEKGESEPRLEVRTEAEAALALIERQPPEAEIRAMLLVSRELAALVRSEAPELAQIRELEGASNRARTSGLLPELRLRGAHGFDQTVTPGSTAYYGDGVTTRDGWDTALEARLTFRLARLLYDDAESSHLSMKQKLHAQIEKRVEEALLLLSAWQKASLRARAALEEERLEEIVKRDAALLQLDLLTAGKILGLLEKHLGKGVLDVGPVASPSAPRETPEAPEKGSDFAP